MNVPLDVRRCSGAGKAPADEPATETTKETEAA